MLSAQRECAAAITAVSGAMSALLCDPPDPQPVNRAQDRSDAAERAWRCGALYAPWNPVGQTSKTEANAVKAAELSKSA
ncbi:hypothetical protein ACH4E7_40820 [Kitasatospora sp. NPDC018058]|uniref:hypothetical protein n=1 Tax=Kitasatospora sp. NPDC018058 TaxID=3364025 RepID=UPI0037C05DE2